MLARAAATLLALLLLGGSAAFAQVGFVFNRTGSGARAAGMANAFIAISDDGTAASWNPAGLGQLRKPELSIVSNTTGKTLTAAGFRTLDGHAVFGPVQSSYTHTDLDFASLAVPVTLWGKAVTFQAAWRRLYSLDYREVVSFTREPVVPEGPPPILIDGNTDLVGGVDLVSLAVAAKLTSRLALGGSLNVWRGEWNEDDAVSETPLSGPDLPRYGMTHQTNRIRGDSFTLGLMLTYPAFNLGLVYKSPLSSTYEAEARGSRSGEPPIEPIEVEGNLRFPTSLGLGGAWRPAPRWTVALDLTWDEWSDTLIDTPLTGLQSLFDGLPPERTATRDTLSWNAGAEHLFLGEGFIVPLRFGVAYEPQGARSPYTRDPVNYTMLAVGTGYNTNRLKFDAAFQYRWASVRDGATFGLADFNPLLPDSVGERTAREWRLKLSVILRLTDTDNLRKKAKAVFVGGP